MTEQDMVNNFINAKNKPLKVYAYDCSSHDYPDLVFDAKVNGIDRLVMLESKIENDDNYWNYAKQLMAEILINRKYETDTITKLSTSKYDVLHGLLLNFEGKKTDKVHKYLYNHILPDDWNKFGNIYHIEYVFLIDKDEIYFTPWSGFLNSTTVTNYQRL